MAMMILLLILPLRLMAPGFPVGYIAEGEVLFAYNVSDSFLRAVIRYESNWKERAVNPHTKARGILQILPVMIREVNKYSDIKYTWSDAYDPVKSIEMWNVIMQAKNPEYYWDRCARIWFGTGTQYDGKTWCEYYMEVTALIN